MTKSHANGLSDRNRWDQRYRQGAYAERTWPSAYLHRLNEEGAIPVQGHALDVACGRGRNSLFLAANGFRVDAVDVSAVAIAQAANTAIAQNLRVNWQCRNLLHSSQVLPENTYSVAVMFRFVAPTLLPQLVQTLTPDGVLVLEEHLQWNGTQAISGPTSHRFRVAPGELIRQLHETGIGFDVLDQFEGLIEEHADGSESAQAAVARVCIRRHST